MEESSFSGSIDVEIDLEGMLGISSFSASGDTAAEIYAAIILLEHALSAITKDADEEATSLARSAVLARVNSALATEQFKLNFGGEIND
ncbi:hypothetical protein LP032_020 [Listeria phage LP-032]|uniref:Uncharacterized protein n=11 Tax=Homburgvirus TaxID=1921125 RepID=A0A6C0QZV6_9CAUD|nr:hypothetical protein P70_0053 [Listeria phage P70]YP_008240473.1 hypothetical protein LP110_109 [Listeria phage LP-110]YP_008240505.1 hypothetical protein LP037_027 [Listeria phage LP-037]YP_009044115.1 hypothetical protein LP026_030 [Listeria phage LP-026]YP_009045086.1 hypothetical protein LP114_032 [Listeria phage LP-114]AHL18869.1 hypothetical protein LP032_020 [Listeria phage LP-032]AWY07691.1 hypothetical protein [Listeria phage LP-KV022]QDK04555.1 hypothetical protein FK481_0041 [L